MNEVNMLVYKYADKMVNLKHITVVKKSGFKHIDMYFDKNMLIASDDCVRTMSKNEMLNLIISII